MSHSPEFTPQLTPPLSPDEPPEAARADPADADHSEEDLADVIDDAVPTRSYSMMHMVGLGGSAGSIQALREFFIAAAPDAGMAYVVVVHLAADRESSLAELIQQHTEMTVVQVGDTARVEANHVYVIPPGRALAASDGFLRLADLPEERGKRVAVDLFFRTLADTHGPHATAIVLSGADGDGAIGIKRVKERGGLTIVQDPDEAEHSGMPRAAISTGMIDWVLPVGAMPERLRRYHELEPQLRLPPEEGPQPAKQRKKPTDEREAALREVLALLHQRTGHDFTYYKRATILRRIARRMRINERADLTDYLAFLRTHSGEPAALLQDLLISVTNFFRDKEAFAALQAQIPGLLQAREEEPLRVWVPACATGEEAYSIAMLLAEHSRDIDVHPTFQIFATDLDSEAIRHAREAVYPATIAADVSDERLRRFFSKDFRGYRLRSEIRESVLFATHDLLKDSPFSRIDLLTCRNLMIYLDREAQTRALDIMHFALRPGGRLFLGTSETAEHSSNFTVVDKKHRIYAPRPTRRTSLPVPIGPRTVARALELQERERNRPKGPSASTRPRAAEQAWQRVRPRDGETWRDLHLRLVERLAPPSLVVSETHEIVHLSENAGHFLTIAGGEPSMNLLSVVHPSLIVEMRTALLRAEASTEGVQSRPLAIEIGGEKLVVTLRVARAADLAAGYFLVVFDHRPIETQGNADDAPAAPAEMSDHDRALEREVEDLKWHLRDLTERRDLAIEELKAGNEELQAMNEELRSATEELETSREELQSINEELTTVNHEMKGKVDELARSNSDLQNLIAATTVAAVFLSRDLRITRYTPSAVSIFKLIASDHGRPLADLASNLIYPEMIEDAEAVLADLVPREREVAGGSHWYLARALPYRTGDDRIAGVVLTFIDITTRKAAEMALRLSEERFRNIVSQASAGVCHSDLDRRITLVNTRYCEITGYPTEQLVGRSMFDITHADDRERSSRMFANMLENGQPYEIEKRYIRPDGAEVWVNNAVTLVRDQDGRPDSAISISLDITERKRSEAALRESNERLRYSEERMRAVLDNAVEYAIITMDLERRITSWNVGAERILGWREPDVIGHPADMIFTPEDCAAQVPEQEAATALREGRAADEKFHVRRDQSRFFGSGVMTPLRDGSGGAVGLLKIFRDTSEQRESQQALETSRRELEQALAENELGRLESERASQAKDRFLAMLSHELRTPLTPVVMAVYALDRATDLPESVRATLAVIRRNVRAEMVLIDDLLDLTRITSGKLEMTPEPLDLHDAVRGAVEVCEAEIRARRQSLELHLGAERFNAEGDFHRLRQVFWNLLRNASKFTGAGGTITLRTSNSADHFVLAVEDTGIGIDAEKLDTIFDAFEQGGDRISREFGGLGLGLAIAKAMIDAHHGTLHAKSEGSGRGATFTVELPLNPS